jgi:hypothetical protein
MKGLLKDVKSKYEIVFTLWRGKTCQRILHPEGGTIGFEGGLQEMFHPGEFRIPLKKEERGSLWIERLFS